MNDFNEDTVSQISTALKVAQIMEKTKSGTPMNEVVISTQGGKSKAQTQKEKSLSDSLRRKQVLDKLKKRTFRGENSLAEDIARRIRQCQTLMRYISKASSLGEKEVLSIQRNLESTFNRATSLVKEIEVLEGAIERKKQEDPVISDYESKSAELLQAIKNNDYGSISDLRSYCESNSSIYNLRQKRLKPYLVKARQVRLKFVAEKRRLMRIQYQTYSQAAEVSSMDIDKGKLHYLSEEDLQTLTSAIQDVRQIRMESKPVFEKIGQPLGNVALSFISDLETELNSIDSTYLEPMNQKVETIMETMSHTGSDLETNPEEEKAVKEESKSRMAYQEKKENE